MKVGQGFDVHALVAGRKLVIGGVTIPYEKGLEGHSDADVLYAICDLCWARCSAPSAALSRYRSLIPSRIAVRFWTCKEKSAEYKIVNIRPRSSRRLPLAPHVPGMI